MAYTCVHTTFDRLHCNFLLKLGRVILVRGHKDHSKMRPVKKFTDTIKLPNTSFPLRVPVSKRVELDLFIYDKCKFAHLYEWQRQNKEGKEFILHDGPPYANGELHMGHAINKILKDITLRQKFLQGFKIHYVPGWDCHGLPIELKAIADSTEKLNTMEIRKEARKMATKALQAQMKVFQSWGIMANWHEHYTTCSIEYVKNQLNQFYNLYERGLIYQDVKPVYWSPSSGTALAEAELIYNHEHVSKAILVEILLSQVPEFLISMTKPSHLKALIWTTTPWTLPANQAICFNPKLSYCVASVSDSNNNSYLLATDAAKEIGKMMGKKLTVLKSFAGDLLENVKYYHPIETRKELCFLPGSHVTSDKGSGLVHTAPAHGPEDFLVALKYNIPVLNLVDESGRYSSEAGGFLEGLCVLDEGNAQVMHMLQPSIVHIHDYIHSYPYDWRTKKPIIIKASRQWFINTEAIKEKAVELLRDVNVYPQKFECHSTLISQLEKRPYWCISRQRVWGVPIPVLYKKGNEQPIISRDLIDHYKSLLDKYGCDFWWSLPQETIASGHLLKTHGLNESSVEKGKDILDIWFDSGLSWSYVLGEEKIADLYLEGMDQYTGWFQSSLMTSVALRGKSPFSSLYVHGFAVDGKGHKMSKSIGNVVDPQEITCGGDDLRKLPAFGVDTLRWWVASHASQNAVVPVTQSIMETSAAEVQKIRSVLRFLLGSLSDFNFKEDIFPLKNFYLLDLWMLHKLKIFENEVYLTYNKYQYNRVCKILLNFVTNEVSSIYCHMIKDRLYCDKGSNVNRIASQYVVKNILETLAAAAAPVLPFLIEECYLHYPRKSQNQGENEQTFFCSHKRKLPEHWNFPDAQEIVMTAFKVKEILNKKVSGNTLELHVSVHATGENLINLRKFSQGAELNEILQVSSSEIMEGTSSELWINIESSHGKQCPRCWLYTVTSSEVLCNRCDQVIQELEASRIIN